MIASFYGSSVNMPPKQNSYKISGVLILDQDQSEEEFSIFMKAMDDNHAVMLVREHLRSHAPPGRSVVKGIEKK
jgi:hypothetical protein